MTKQLQDRAFTALMNHQLLLRYAVANDVVSDAFIPVVSDRVSESVSPDALKEVLLSLPLRV